MHVYRSSRFVALTFCTALVATLVLPASAARAEVDDGNVVIEDNSHFDREHGVRAGKGTRSNPYVIEGWDLHNLEIHNTNRYVVIRNNIIGRLTLNWVGNRVKVIRNKIRDLRVNENVERTAEATSGVISFNRFGHVGQLRHWDGLFSHNVVDSPPDENDPWNFDLWPNGFRVANFDGFNGARYLHNTFYGYVEVRLHGHHHSSGFGRSSHYHGAEDHGGPPLSHMERFHRAVIADNKIYSSGPYGLIYTDSNHAANDRTAASETNEALENPHAHHTRVAFLRNDLIGSGIVVDIFNADDSQKHLRTETGHFTIRGNTVRLREYRMTGDGWNEPPVGIEVHEARDLHLTIADNKISSPAAEMGRAATDSIGGHVASGIELWDVEKAFIHLTNNYVSNRVAGVYARRFNRVQWWIRGLKTEGVETEVDYDNSSSKPQGGGHDDH